MTRDYDRHAAPLLVDALGAMPAVLLHGPRQSGKTTLARSVGDAHGYAYETFDDEDLRRAALADPKAFIGGLPERVVLDEIQRVPEFFTTLKLAIDRRRTNGRFLLTGSANVLLLPKLSDSLAGRLGIVRLQPLAQCELARRPSDFVDRLLGDGFGTTTRPRLGGELIERVVAGGFPAALAQATPRRRTNWYLDYVETQIQRDVSDFSRIRSLDALPRLLTLAAAQTARLVNITELAGPLALNRQTIHDYVALLERIFAVERLPAWSGGDMGRIVKSPKLHVLDTGVACALLGLDVATLASDRDRLGPLLETFVLHELERQASWNDTRCTFHHYRDRDAYEVDIVIEYGGRKVVGIEVKAGATVHDSDFRGLRRLQSHAGKRFTRGVVLYDGETCASFGDGMHVVPIRALWEKLRV